TAMRRAFDCEVAVENDVNLGVLGEHWLGRGQGKKDLAFVALGTGIGLGLISNGRLVRGAHGAAAEIGYLPLGADPFDPRNVESGTLESFVGTAGIVRRYVQAGGSNRAGGAKTIFEAMAKGEAIAAGVIEDTARLTALGLASVVVLLDPELLILGGGIGSRPEFVALVERFLAACLPRPVPVVASTLENRATLIGAVAMGLSGLYESLFGARVLPDAAAHSRRDKLEARSEAA
ncbi:MAG: ROK family protein, partial [Dongiaceae bacterium]